MDKEFIATLSRDNIKVLETAYKTLLKNAELLNTTGGAFYSDHIEDFLGIDKSDVDFLTSNNLLEKYSIWDPHGTTTKWFLGAFFDKLTGLKPLFDKEDGRFELRFKLYRIFDKKNFEDAFNWVFESDKSEWDKKLQCIKYNSNIFGTECSDETLEESKKLYELLNK